MIAAAAIAANARTASTRTSNPGLDELSGEEAGGSTSFAIVMRGVVDVPQNDRTVASASKTNPASTLDQIVQPVVDGRKENTRPGSRSQLRGRRQMPSAENRLLAVGEEFVEVDDQGEMVSRGKGGRDSGESISPVLNEIAGANFCFSPTPVQPATLPALSNDLPPGPVDVPVSTGPLPAIGARMVSSLDELPGVDGERSTMTLAQDETKPNRRAGEFSELGSKPSEEIKTQGTLQITAARSAWAQSERPMTELAETSVPRDVEAKLDKSHQKPNPLQKNPNESELEKLDMAFASDISCRADKTSSPATAKSTSASDLALDGVRFHKAQRGTNEGRDVVSSQEMSADGMFVAQPVSMMKTAGNGDNLSQRGEQNLPPGEISTVKLPSSVRLKIKPRILPQGADFSVEPSAGVQAAWAALAGGERVEHWSPVTEARGAAPVSTSADSFATQISKQAIALKHFNAESMAVVLKPDPATAIFLHLRLNDGAVEVHARFERGDFAAMNAKWDQVQQALSTQGIRLGPLQEAASHQTASHASMNFSRTADDSGENHAARNFPAEPAGEAAPPQTVKTGRRRAPQPARAGSKSWESWA